MSALNSLTAWQCLLAKVPSPKSMASISHDLVPCYPSRFLFTTLHAFASTPHGCLARHSLDTPCYLWLCNCCFLCLHLCSNPSSTLARPTPLLEDAFFLWSLLSVLSYTHYYVFGHLGFIFLRAFLR